MLEDMMPKLKVYGYRGYDISVKPINTFYINSWSVNGPGCYMSFFQDYGETWWEAFNYCKLRINEILRDRDG